MTERPLEGIAWILTLIGLSFATLIVALDFSIANVSLPYIAGNVAVGVTQATYLITSFAIGSAIALPLTGFLTERFGAIKTYLYATIGFVFFSLLCGASFTFEMLVFARFCQGFIAGPIIPVSQSLILSITPKEKRNSALAVWGVIIMVGPIMGPVLGGIISDNIGWPWIFYVNLPLGLVALILPFLFLWERAEKGKNIALDYISFALLVVGVTAFQIFLDKGEDLDWFGSPLIRLLALTSFVAFSYLIIRLKRSEKPLIDLSLYKTRAFGLSLVFITIGFIAYIGSIVLVPLWLQTAMGYNATWAGFAVAPVGFAALVFGKFMGKLIDKFGTISLLGICFLCFAAASFYTGLFSSSVDIYHIWISRLLTGIGTLFLFTPLISLSVRDLPINSVPMAMGIFHFHRTIASAIGASITTSLWVHRGRFHYERLVSNIRFSYAAELMEKLALSGKKGSALLAELVSKEAAILGFNDCFWVMGYLFLFMLLLLPLGRRKRASD